MPVPTVCVLHTDTLARGLAGKQNRVLVVRYEVRVWILREWKLREPFASLVSEGRARVWVRG